MMTADILFLPIAVYFFVLVIQANLARPLDWGVGIVLGAALNYFGIIKWLICSRMQTPGMFFQRGFCRLCAEVYNY